MRQKASVFQKINSGIQEVLSNNNLKDKFDYFQADENNVVFVNLRKDDEYPEPFGKKELFNKIKESFKASKIYKDSLKDLNEETLKQKIEKMKNDARSKLFPNKIFGALAGIIPIPFDFDCWQITSHHNLVAHLANSVYLIIYPYQLS